MTNTLSGSRGIAVDALDAFDDQRARSSPDHLGLREPVNVRMVPIQPGRLIFGNAEAVFERSIARLNQGLEHIILMANSGGTVSP